MVSAFYISRPVVIRYIFVAGYFFILIKGNNSIGFWYLCHLCIVRTVDCSVCPTVAVEGRRECGVVGRCECDGSACSKVIIGSFY